MINRDLINTNDRNKAFNMYISQIQQSTQPLVEHAFFAVGDNTTNINTTNRDINTDDNSQAVTAMNNIISKTATQVVNKNKTQASAAIGAANRLVLRNVKTKGKFVLSRIDQSNTVSQNVDISVKTDILTKINNEISNDISRTIAKSFSDTLSKSEGSKLSDIAGSIMAGLGGQCGGAVGVGDNECNISTTNEVISDQDNSQKINLNDEISNELNETITNETLNECAATVAAENEISLDTISADEGVEITDIKQANFVDQVFKCAFDTKIITDVSKKVLTKINNAIEGAISNRTDLTEGDIGQLGKALNDTLNGLGDVVVKSGEGISTAAKGAGEGISTAAKGAGEGLATAASGAGEAVKDIAEGAATAASSFLKPLMWLGIIFAIGLFAWLYFSGSNLSDVGGVISSAKGMPGKGAGMKSPSGFGQPSGFSQPMYNSGFNPGFNHGFNSGFNPGFNSGFNPGFNPGFGQGMGQSMAQGIAQGINQGISQGMGGFPRFTPKAFYI